MKKTISALVAVALLSFGVAFAQQATTTAQTGPKTTTNPVTGATTEKSEKTTVAPTSTGTKTTKKKHKKVTKKSGATKSTTTKSEAETASTPVPATK
jgi:cytoskeletal protein RodZ